MLLLHFSLYTSQEIPSAEEMITFELTGNQFSPHDTITTYRKVAQKFENFQNMLADIPQDKPLPFDTVTNDSATMNQQEIKKSINNLLDFVTLKQKPPLIRSKVDIYIQDPIFIYRQASLQHIKLGLSYAVKDKLDKNMLSNLADIYIEKLFNTDFAKMGTLQNQLNSLPYEQEVDKLITQRLLETIFQKKFPLSSQGPYEGEIQYGEGDSNSIAHENTTTKFNRLSKEFKLYKRVDECLYATLSIIQPLKKSLCYINSPYFKAIDNLDNNLLLITLSTNGSTSVDIRSDGSIVSHKLASQYRVSNKLEMLLTNFNGQGDIHKIVSFEKAISGALDFNKDGKWCAGCNKSLAIFTIDSLYKIQNLKIYDIPTFTEGHITHISMVDNSIAITYKTISGEYEYHFFDLQTRTFIKDNPNKIEMVYYKPDLNTKEVVKKQMFLVRDNHKFIDTAYILKARGFTASHFYYDMVLDDLCENIYVISIIKQNITFVKRYRIIPYTMAPFVKAVNKVVESEIPTDLSLLTLSTLYFISTKFLDFAPKMVLSNELKKKVPTAIRAAVNPPLFKRLVSSFLLGNKYTPWLKGAVALGGLGLAGLLWYNYNRSTSASSTLPLQGSSYSSSAAYGKIKALHK